MRHKRPFRTSSAPFWAQSKPPEGGQRIEDGGSANVEPLRISVRGANRRATEAERLAAMRDERHAVIEDADEARTLQRVGGRRQLRRDVIAVAIGGVFLALALTKPWATAPNDASRQSAQTAQPAVALPSAAASTVPDDAFAALPQRVSVDWNVLTTHDPHAQWGIAIAVAAPIDERSDKPQSRWRPATPNASTDTHPVLVRRDTSVFAIAVTAPRSTTFRSITFQYLGGDASGGAAQDPPPTRPLIAIPLDAIVDLQSSAIDLSAMGSGMFWVAPPEFIRSDGGYRSLSAAWQSVPWPWPLGTYRITLYTDAGVVTLPLRLVQAP